jgi:hypothetical protein
MASIHTSRCIAHGGAALTTLLLVLACSKSVVEPPGVDVPAAIATTWQTGTVSSVNFFNASTGQFSSPTGTGLFYRFDSDGNYEKGMLLQSSLYGCTMTVVFYERGTVTTVEGSLDEGWTLQLHPTYGRQRSRDTCVASNNFEKPHQLADETLITFLGTDEYGYETLFMRYADTDWSAFHRE